METLTVGNVAQIDDIPIISAISITCWRTKWDSNWRYNSENISLRCRPNFRSCHPKWPVEKNPQKGARIYFAPQSHQSSSRPGKWLDHRCFRQFASCGRLVGGDSLNLAADLLPKTGRASTTAPTHLSALAPSI